MFTFNNVIGDCYHINKVLYDPESKWYPNGELDEEIYMMQPEGFITKGQENRLKKV